MAQFIKRGNKTLARAYEVSTGRRVARTFETKREARRWAERIEDGDEAVAVEKRTLNDLADVYLKDETPTKRGARWERIRINRYRTQFPALFEKPLIKIKRADIEALIDERLREVQGSSVNRELNTLCAMFTHARRLEWMTHNPFDTLRRPKNPPPRDRRITPQEISEILEALNYAEGRPVVEQRHKVAVAFLLALETAMRCGEMCKIMWADVHLEERWLFLRHENTKTMQPRKIPLSTEAVRLIKLLPEGEPTKFMLGVRPGVVSTMFRLARIEANIEDLKFHDARHEATTRLAAKVNVLDLARITGHADIKQLQTYYNRDARELADLLG